MTGGHRTVCDVVGCPAVPAGSYLDTSRTPALLFAVCQLHLAHLRNGGRPVVILDGRGVKRPALRLR